MNRLTCCFRERAAAGRGASFAALWLVAGILSACGAGAGTPHVRLVSRTLDGAAGALNSGVGVFAAPSRPGVTDDGEVYFLTEAALDPTADANAVVDVYRWDGSGAVPVSVAGVGPHLSRFGNARGFSLASDGETGVELRPADDLFGAVRAFAWDVVALAAEEIALPPAAGVRSAALGGEGARFVAFSSQSSGIGLGVDGGVEQVYRLDRDSGTVLLLSASPTGEQGDAASGAPSVAAAGAPIAFVSVYLWRQQGRTGSVTLLSRRPDGIPATRAWDVALSADGRVAAFVSDDSSLLPGLPPGDAFVFAADVDGEWLELVSRNGDGEPLIGQARSPQLSEDGRFVVFASASDRLPGADGSGARQVVLRDRLEGTTMLLSVSTEGGRADADCLVPAISPSGRFVSFVSAASNLVADTGPDGVFQVYIVDRGAAFANRIPSAVSDHLTVETGTRVPLTLRGRDPDGDALSMTVVALPDGVSLFDGPDSVPETRIDTSELPYTVTDPDGRVTLEPAPDYEGDARILYTVTDGVAVSPAAVVSVSFGDADEGIATVVSQNGEGTHADADAAPDGTPGRLAISADGSRVAFTSLASNLVEDDTNGAADVLLWDRHAPGLARISTAPAGMPEQPGKASDDAALSPDGRAVAFRSRAALDPADANTYTDIYLRNLDNGMLTLVSRGGAGWIGDGDSRSPDISMNGDAVVFSSTASDLVAADTHGVEQVYLWEKSTEKIVLISRNAAGQAADGDCRNPRLSADGAAVGFDSAAGNLAPNTGHARNVFVFWRVPSRLVRVSVPFDGGELDGDALRPALSQSGRIVAFESDAANLVSGDSNGQRDVFVRDLVAGTTERISVHPEGFQSLQPCFNAALSGNGRFVAFRSRSQELVDVATGGFMCGFLVDRSLKPGPAGRIRLSAGAAGRPPDGDTWNAALSATGRYVALASDAGNLVPQPAGDARDVVLVDFGELKNTAPLAPALSVTTLPDADVQVVLTAYDDDGDDLIHSLAQLPQAGDIVDFDTSGSVLRPYPVVTYVPHSGFTGQDIFTVNVSDGAVTVEQTVVVTVDTPPALALGIRQLPVLVGESTATVTASELSVVDPDRPGQAVPGSWIELFSSPSLGEFRTADGRVLQPGDRIYTTDYPLTFHAYAPGSFGTETVRFQAYAPDWESDVVEMDIAVGAAVQSLWLASGWNLVSFRMHPLEDDPAYVFAPVSRERSIGPVWAWEPETGGYAPVVRIEAGRGYWLYVNGPPVELVDMAGRPVDDGIALLLPGWNLRGPVGSGNDGPLPLLPETVDRIVWAWDSGLQTYRDARKMVAGAAYWFRCRGTDPEPVDFTLE
jgi:Tol biopolymer transport system component